MNTKETIDKNVEAREEVIDLGVASVETKGKPGLHTEIVNQFIMPGISEE